jgi:K+-transporting ATPase ATPase C chain
VGRELKVSLAMLLVLAIVTGVIYPLVVTGIGRLVFPRASAGSLIERDGRAVGSRLIGQPFDDPRYFWGRPSATGPVAYNAAASSGSNVGPTNPAKFDAIKARVEALRAADPGQAAPIPIDLVTASGSGLDPDISPAAAAFQVPRVARSRGLDEAAVRRLVAAATRERDLGLLGEPRVNVLALNLALDERGAAKPAAGH